MFESKARPEQVGRAGHSLQWTIKGLCPKGVPFHTGGIKKGGDLIRV